MPPQDTWAKIEADFNTAYADPDFGPLRPLLECVQSTMNVRDQVPVESLLACRILIDALHRFRDKLREGPQGLDGMRQITGAVAQTLNAEGNIFSAHNIVLQWINTTEKAVKLPEPGVEVSLVLVAMTSEDAKRLAAREVFTERVPELRENFDKLVQHLEQSGQANWIDNYGGSPELWRPRGGAETIGQQATTAIETLNKRRVFPKPFVPKFYDIRAVNGEDAAGRDLLRRFRSRGCIVVIDAISIRHPALLRIYQRSGLDVFPSTSIVTLTPDGNTFALMNTMVYALQLSLAESELSSRMNDLIDAPYCQEFSDNRKMSVWLVDMVQRTYGPAAAEGAMRTQIQA